ncbi:MAG: RNase J family beta-CASP ribonuclease [Clostridiales bacterium]|nr:RNase J family beta-CASP ribonuclease [Clostridiales bacterium]
MPTERTTKTTTRRASAQGKSVRNASGAKGATNKTVQASVRQKTVKPPRASKKNEPNAVSNVPKKTAQTKTVKSTRTSTAVSRTSKKTALKADFIQETPAATITPVKVKRSKQKPVKVLFLGGVGEIGKNMTAIEYGNDIIIIDAGMTFPNMEEMPGIDSVVPDITYLAQNKEKVRGVFITHGHEDHIGGLSYLMKELQEGTPVYGTKLTLMLAENKLQENRVSGVVQRVVKAGDRVKAGAFEVEFVGVNHSISGACALAIRTPCGLIYHSGDFKIDLTPVAGDPIDLNRISELGKEGVLLYMAESTNIERPGYTMSETVVGATLDHLFGEHMNKRIIIATFASNVHRLQQIIDLAVKYRRKVALSGRSMLRVTEAAMKIGELRIPEGVLIDIEQTKNMFDRELVIVSTGSQGEPMSALTRMSQGEYNKVTVGANDAIIISAHPIPGNEKMVYRVINNLYKLGATVIYESLENIHVSGHACKEEHKILHNLLKPKFFIPVHGEYRHLKRHVDLAQTLGLPAERTLIAEIGNCVELTESSMRFGESIPAGAMLIDGEVVEGGENGSVVKERLKMSSDGIYLVSLAVTGDYVVGDPEITSIGVVTSENKCTLPELVGVAKKALENYRYTYGGKEELSAHVRKSLRNYLFKRMREAPMVVVNILEV